MSDESILQFQEISWAEIGNMPQILSFPFHFLWLPSTSSWLHFFCSHLFILHILELISLTSLLSCYMCSESKSPVSPLIDFTPSAIFFQTWHNLCLAQPHLTHSETEYLYDIYSVFVLPIFCIFCKYTHTYVHTMELEFEIFLQNFALRVCIWHLLYLTVFQGRRRWRMGKSKSRDAQIAKGKNEIWQCRNLWQKSAEILAKT